MRKNFRKRLTALLSFVLILAMMAMPLQAATAQPYAWPGRPGGNGDGSEEWLQGFYGETNGPYKKIHTKKGKVSTLNKEQAVADTIGLGIVSVLLDKVLPGTSILVKGGFVTALGIAKNVSGTYEGVYYTAKTSISGRCMKTVIDTYGDKERTIHVATYKRYTKW